MVFCIDTYRTWIEVADDNLYKEHVISRNTRTDFRGLIHFQRDGYEAAGSVDHTKRA